MTRSQKKNDQELERKEQTPTDQHAGPTGFQPDGIEREVLRQWEAEKTFEESVKQRASAPRYSFYDGPPYATGAPHYGHILQSTLKDTVTRYWTMQGRRVDRRVGWDCHGLPVENMVEAELNMKTKQEIEQYTVEKFNAKCREAVMSRVDDFTTLLRRLGRWADYSNAYRTMDTSFMESAWWVFKTAWDHELVYKGMRSSSYCPRCETPLSHHETVLGYQTDKDPAITVKLSVVGKEKTFLLVWTTTPWTLPANAAVAAHPDLAYVRIRVGGERWILAKDRLEAMVRESYKIEEEFPGSVLVGAPYTPLFTFVPVEKPAFRVVSGTFVSATDGTGLVHIAPAFGEDDLRLAQEEDLPLLRTIDSRARFIDAVKLGKGRFVRDENESIIENLQQRGLLAGQPKEILHEYPHCWRCSHPLIYMAVDSWFIAVTKIKAQLVKNTENIRWIPAHLKEGRFGQGLRDAPDWAVSRSRYWGIPLPVWECTSCGEETVIGSIAEMEAAGGNREVIRSPYADIDLHRPYVDRVVLRCASCGQEAHRVPEVLDVWFDAGSMPYGQWHYPFENKELVEKTFPADFIGEALDQTRGWFYTLHVLAGILTRDDLGLGKDRPAFKNVTASGLILAEDGRKLSKRLGNYVDPVGVIEKYGADTLRLYLLTATSFGEDMRFSDRLVGELYKKFTLILWNVWQYYRTYAGDKEIGKHKEKPSLLDRWILARVAQLGTDVQKAMEQYHIDDAARQLLPFVDELSTWYVRRSRGRAGALPVLREVLRQFSIVAAPFVPFLAEHIHRELTTTSPHLEDWPTDQLPKLNGKTSEVGLLEQMQLIREVASAGQRARAEAKMKVRQPLSEVMIVGAFPALEAAGEEGLALLRDELNVKAIRVESRPPRHVSEGSTVWVDIPGGKLGLNTELTVELRQEGRVRDLIRHIQGIRKNAGCRFDERIVTHLDTDNTDVRDAVERFASILKEETKSTDIQLGRATVTAEDQGEIDGAAVWVGITRQQ